MELTPSLNFQPQKAAINLEVDGNGPKTRAISLTIKPHERCDIRTIERRSLRSVVWSIVLKEREVFSEEAKENGAIGLLHHSPESSSYDYSFPESCFASVAVGPSTFNTVLESLTMGHLPSFISISVKGMSYGDDPDGRQKIWDTESARHLSIMDVSIDIPMAATISSESQEEEEMNYEPPAPLATSADAYVIGERVTAAIAELQVKVLHQLKWFTAIAIVAVLAMKLG